MEICSLLVQALRVSWVMVLFLGSSEREGEAKDEILPRKVEGIQERVLKAACGWRHTVVLLNLNNVTEEGQRVAHVMGSFARWPSPLLHSEFLPFLDSTTLCRLAQVNKTWKSITESDNLWLPLFQVLFSRLI